jgi:hypothetical protein
MIFLDLGLGIIFECKTTYKHPEIIKTGVDKVWTKQNH